MDLSTIIPIIGGVLGAAGSGDKTQSATQTRTPWAPAQPYMIRDLERNNALADRYAAKPFSDLQNEMYGNLFSDIRSNRQNFFPSMMDFANRGMNTSYSRNGGSHTSLGLPSQGSGSAGGGSAGGGQPFDLNAMMDPQTAETVAAKDPYPMQMQQMPVMRHGGYNSEVAGNDWSTKTPAQQAEFFQQRPTWGAIDGFLQDASKASLGGLLSSLVNPEAGAQRRMIANGIDPTGSEYGPPVGAMGDRYGPPVSAMVSQDGESTGTEGTTRAMSGGFGDSDGGSSNFKGGEITQSKVVAPRTDGDPDDAYISAQKGEYVIKKATASKLGKGLLDAINDGKVSAKQIRGLLA